ncbi:uncharacterized protein METZ01_LOCUS414237, partial [marine metagenome]
MGNISPLPKTLIFQEVTHALSHPSRFQNLSLSPPLEASRSRTPRKADLPLRTVFLQYSIVKPLQTINGMQSNHGYVNTINKTLTTYIKNKRIKYLSTLLVGYGYWGKNLARNFARDGNLAGICDTNKEKLLEANKLYGELGAIKLYNEYEHAVIDSNVDNIVIATPAESHYKLASQAMIEGRDVWIEKPACCDLSSLEALKTIAKEKGKIIFIDHTFCYNPAVIKMKELLDEIGRPLY